MTDREFERQVTDHLHIVRIIAAKLHPRLPVGVELEDLVHMGILGLIDAVRRYDAGRGTQFSTYASVRIRGAIMDELRNMDWASRSLRRKIKDMEKAFEALEIKLGRPPREEEVAESLDMELSNFQTLLSNSRGVGLGVFRIEAGSEGNLSDGDILNYYPDDGAGCPALRLEKNRMKETLAAFIGGLPEKEKLVLSLYYMEGLNLKEVGKVLNLTESRICQIRMAAIMRLRSRLAELACKNRVSTREIL